MLWFIAMAVAGSLELAGLISCVETRDKLAALAFAAAYAFTFAIWYRFK
jgi:hypothetical protein